MLVLNEADRMGNKTIYIICPISDSPESLTRLLKEDAGVGCVILNGFDELPDGSGNSPLNDLVVWDSQGKECAHLFNWLNGVKPTRPKVAVLNVAPEMHIESDAINHGVLGVFYINDSSETISKGIANILKGELWYSRGILTRFVKDQTHPAPPSSDNKPQLSSREEEILGLVASGMRNIDIAKVLSLSPHTIRNHIHNIFKRIGVDNRLQATLWATHNLE